MVIFKYYLTVVSRVIKVVHPPHGWGGSAKIWVISPPHLKIVGGKYPPHGGEVWGGNFPPMVVGKRRRRKF